MKPFAILSILLGVVFSSDAAAQCSDITIGSYDGTPVAGNANTPFATNTGSNARNGQRVQYIYPASELLADGLCPGPITKVTFYALEADHGLGGTCVAFVDCPYIKVDVRLGHSELLGFGPYVESQEAPLSVPWDAPTEASSQLYAYSFLARSIETGAMHFTLAGDGFLWNGIDNLVMDISWQRAAPLGISPAFRLEEDLPYTATKWVQVLTSFHPGHGNMYQDDPLTANASTGTTFNRPVTTFNSSLVEMPLAVPEEMVNEAVRTFFDPATGSVVITRPAIDQGAWSVVCTDITGRTIAQGFFPSGSETIRIPLKEYYQGVVVLFAVRADGSRLDLGRLIPMQ